MLEPVRFSELRPLRSLAMLAGGALVLMAALLGGVVSGQTPDRGLLHRLRAAADTDTVALALPDTTQADTTQADTTRVDTLATDAAQVAVPPDTTWRVRRYLPAHPDRPVASLFPRRDPLSVQFGNYWRHQIALDSAGRYVARERVGEADVRLPLTLDREAYLRERRERAIRENWNTLAEQRARQRQQKQRGGLGVNIAVPGGRSAVFSTLFGPPTVDLRVTGQADIRAGFDYRKSDQQGLLTGDPTQVDPDFKQDLRLGVTGTIGDKLRVDVNWDTNRDFDYQNQLKLQYTGYDDEILQSVEAGNVFLNTPSTLIRGGQSLFGIKTEWQIGGVHLTTVASTQKGQSNSLSVEGGAESTTFDKRPTDYDERTHFFLGYYFRNRWEEAHLFGSDPTTPTLFDGFRSIGEIEVWRLKDSQSQEENERQAIAMVDLGEPTRLLIEANAYECDPTEICQVPDEENDQYTDAEIATNLVPSEANPEAFLTDPGRMEVALSSSDFQKATFRRLTEAEYTVDTQFGYITLQRPLEENEAVAVAYTIITQNGDVFAVGDIGVAGGGDNSQTSNRLVLKLLRPQKLQAPAQNADGTFSFNPAAWWLEMRNIYDIGGDLKQTDFELRLEYEPPGQRPSEKIPEVTGQQKLLQALGLDRTNEQGAPSPDDLFDFNYLTLDARDGLLIFPYLQPFGNRINELITQNNGDAEDRAQYVFNELYTQKRTTAELVKSKDVYRIRGEYKGSVNEFFDLKAFSGLVPGSVRVTSGGIKLEEGRDYIVDYQGGTVTITNPAYLTSGRDIDIDYEQNALFQLQTKTLLGARAEYTLSDKFGIGSTIMRLSQNAPVDKFRLGEEPISNTIWGLDGTLNLEPRWITRVVDALPFLQTKAPSSFSLNGEFAQLRPGHSQTNAFEDSRQRLLDDGRDFTGDELDGISYVDDFESFENTYSLMQPGAWRLSAAPAVLEAVDGDPTNAGRDLDSLRTTWRGTFAWYSMNESLLESVISADPELRIDNTSRRVPAAEVFPNIDPSARDASEQFISTLDLFYEPAERGPYNYTTRLDSFILNPKLTWGGMVQRLPDNYSDFSLQNVEFVEFIMQVPDNPTNPDAKLYLDLGVISEQILPDGKLNDEDGLSLSNTEIFGGVRWARLPQVSANKIINTDEETGLTEDVGIDGLASFPGNRFDPSLTETFQFQNFLGALNDQNRNLLSPDQQILLDREIARAQRDPSKDDYHHFGENAYFREFYPGDNSVRRRFVQYFSGLELNGIETQAQFGQGENGNTRFPDTEDLNFNTTDDNTNNYFEYQLALHPDSLRELAQPDRIDDYVVEAVNPAQGWYLIRVPVEDFTRRVGDSPDFGQIETIRLWTTGHEQPVTVRFASLELVGSQWRASDDVAAEDREGLGRPGTPVPIDQDVLPDPMDETRLSIASINNEESRSYSVPPGTVLNRIRRTSGTFRDAREQSLVLRVENLEPGEQQAVFKTFRTGVDLLKYGHLRMFAHMHGTLEGGRDLVDLAREDLAEARSKVKLFVRLGADQTNSYYEYEQPLTPSPAVNVADPNSAVDPDVLWQTFVVPPGGSEPVDLNSVHIVLSALNQLKFARDERGVPTDEIFWNDLGGVRLDPAVDAFAPPGTRIGVKGTPSLARVNTIVIGVRNPDGSEDVLDDVTVYVNELRASGYDERTGWSALMNADLALADLARVKANFQLQTDGFGALSSTLGERSQIDLRNWSVNTQFSADKFIPERFGWTIPLTAEVKSNTSSPRFDPNRGDVRVEDLVDAIEADTAITEEALGERRREIIESAQTHSMTRSITARVQKTGSRSRLLRNTLDGISTSYSFTESDQRTPRQAINDSWNWATSLGYRLSLRKPRTVRPLGVLDDVPVLGLLSGLQFNYLPQALSLTGTATRRYSESQERPNVLRNANTSTSSLPDIVAFDLRDSQAFSHNRRFSIQYNPFGFLNFGFDTNTDQSLDAAGVDTLFTVVRVDSLGNEQILWENDPTRRLEDAINEELINEERGDQGYELDRLNVKPAFTTLGDAFFGDGDGDPRNDLRTERYESRLSATLRPNLDKIKALNWLDLQDFRYNATFSWRNGAVRNNAGATAGTRVDFNTGLTLRPQELWQKFGFYRKLEEQQRAVEEARRQEREERDRAREEARKQKAAEEAARRQAEEDELLRGQVGAPDSLQLKAPVIRRRTTPAAEPVEEVAAEETAEADTTAAAEEGKDGPSFPLPLPNPVSLLRRTFLAITGVRDFNLTYNGARSIDASNVGEITPADTLLQNVSVHYSLFDAIFRDQGPPLGYRFGFDRNLDPNDRIITDRVQVSDRLTGSNRFQARTSINPGRNLRISLNWNVEFTDREDLTYRREGGEVFTTPTRSGDNSASVWAFRADYLDLVRRQYQTYLANPNGAAADSSARVLLTDETLSEDFREAYLNGLGPIDGRGLLPFPMPSWQVTYSGIAEWPIIRRLTQSASLRHGYGADYAASYRTNLQAGTEETFLLGLREITYFVPETQLNSLRVNERFQPLIGLDLTFKGNVQTSLAWNRSNAYSLATSSNQVRENKTGEITATMSYQLSGLTLPFLPGKRLNNQIGLSLTASHSVNDERTLRLREALIAGVNQEVNGQTFDIEDALQTDFATASISTKRLIVAPKISYRFSNRVTADFFLRYEKLASETGQPPETTNLNGGFNVRVSISN